MSKARSPKTSSSLAPGPTLSENFGVKFKDKGLQDTQRTHKAVFIIVFELAAPVGVLYVDEMKIVPAAG